MSTTHAIHHVTAFEKVADFTLKVFFGDGTVQVIDFRPVLRGAIYGELRNPDVFDQVAVDPEAQTLVWPNGADFDPAILHDWPVRGPQLAALARTWHLPAGKPSE